MWREACRVIDMGQHGEGREVALTRVLKDKNELTKEREQGSKVSGQKEQPEKGQKQGQFRWH